jgi:phosphoribosylamine--glycine ligase
MIEGLEITGEAYTGVLYAGLIIRDGDIYVLEFNVRFGDPETQSIMMRLESDIIEIFEKTITGSLHTCTPRWHDAKSLCVVCASPGYPGSYEKDLPITGLDIPLEENKVIFPFRDPVHGQQMV